MENIPRYSTSESKVCRTFHITCQNKAGKQHAALTIVVAETALHLKQNSASSSQHLQFVVVEPCSRVHAGTARSLAYQLDSG